MYLEKIEIQGFKSFANKTTLIFPKPENKNKGITAIVGPNGSGKSNVVDAIRWVLGEQSLKTLRGKKSKDIIFHGSNNRSRLGRAEVTLFINNKDKAMPIEYSELMLTRRLYRDGESEYLINKGKAKLNEIIMLLAKANFGQKSFSIVGQGMIDYILQAGFKERKEFFDEAVGVKQYQIKRHKSINDLRRTNINLEQIKITLTELEPRVKMLSRQAKKLEKRKSIKEKLKELQIGYYGNIYFNLNDKINNLNIKLKEKHSHDKEISEELLNLQKKLAIFAKESDRDKKFNELKERFDIFNNKKNTLLKKLTILKGEINIEYKKSGQLDLAWITKSKDDLEDQKNTINRELVFLNDDKNITKRKVDNYKNNLLKINNELSDIENKLKEISTNQNVNNDEKWLSILNKTIEIQNKLLSKIKSATDINDLKDIKKIAIKIKENLKKLTKKEKDDVSKTISILSEKENVLIQEKSDVIQNINSLNTKLGISDEKIKMIKLRLIETNEKLEDIEKEIRQSQSRKNTTNIKEYQKQELELKNKLSDVEKKIAKTSTELDNFNKTEQQKKDKAFSLQDKIQEQQIRLNRSKNQINELMIELTRLETRKEDLEREVDEELGCVKTLSKEKAKQDIEIQKIHRLKSQLELIGGIDPETLEEFKESQERYDFLTEQITDLEKASAQLEKIIENLDKVIKNKFNESFVKINKNFNKYFKTLFNGGDAKLVKSFRDIKEEIYEEEDNTDNEADSTKNNKKKPRQEIGIEIHAAPHGKKLKDINILSGGERSLTSIALICSIISINPSPFVILDEVDAALDEANSIRFSKILKNLSHKTQFITITHNRATMEVAKVLYGVTMQEKGVSKIISVNIEDAKESAAR